MLFLKLLPGSRDEGIKWGSWSRFMMEPRDVRKVRRLLLLIPLNFRDYHVK